MPNKDLIKEIYNSDGVWYVTKNLKVEAKNFASNEEFIQEIFKLHKNEIF